MSREREPGLLAEASPDTKRRGLLRAKLRFVAADQAPVVEALFTDADAEFVRLGIDYLRGFRLPCLRGQEVPLELIQELHFDRWQLVAPVLWSQPSRQLRFNTPTGRLSLPSFSNGTLGKAVLQLQFPGPQAEPKVEFLFSNLTPEAERVALRHVRAYRLVDDAELSYPLIFTQQFNFADDGGNSSRYDFKSGEFKLLDFVAHSVNFEKLPVLLDLDSMQCPFSLRVDLRQPYMANVVTELGGAPNANRAYLRDWLAKLQLTFPSETERKAMFGESVRLQIPCGRFDLRPEAS